MKKFKCLLLIQFLLLNVYSFGQIRYVDDLPGNIIKLDFPYQTVNLSDCWRKGNKPQPNQLLKNDNPSLYNPSNNSLLVPGSTTNNKCFNYYEYGSLKRTYNENDTTYELSARMYSLEGDTAKNRKAMIYFGGGIGFFDNPPMGSGLRYWDYFDDNTLFTLKNQDVQILDYLTKKGFVVFYLDVRKGWDIKGISNLNQIPPFENYWFPKHCACEDSCDAFSFIENYYRNTQDLIAFHSKLIKEASTFNIDPNGISYFANSSGANSVYYGTFGRNNFPLEKVPRSNNGTGELINMETKLGKLDRFIKSGITLNQIKVDKIYSLSAAIPDTNWIELSDSICFIGNNMFPVYIAQGSEDISAYSCGGFSRGFKYQGRFDSVFYVMGGSAIHDRILNLGKESHLVTQWGFPHGGPISTIKYKCYNSEISDTCFRAQSEIGFYKSTTRFVLDYFFVKRDKFIHSVLLPEPSRENYNGQLCNECRHIMIADKDSLQSKKYSCCTQDCDRLFENISTGVFPSYFANKIEELGIYPNLIHDISRFKIPNKMIFEEKILQIFNSNGFLIYSEAIPIGIQDYSYNFSNYINGMYFVIIKTENGLESKGKVIKL